ncbi:MAG: N-6 DNA methylase [Anaerolineae bacterium]|nr:N-6 DNA methylase [Anaerolineae bacterium]
MPAPAEIVQLVELFQRNYDQYCAPSFSEAAVRHQFIDPFFAALGWDVNNTQGFAEQYKEVVHEDKVLVGDATKAPDYSFRIGKERKFFVEAKKPSVNIKHDIEPAYQLRRYAWSAKLPLSILTDFEEFSVYDCRMRPDKSDKAATGRILLLNFTDYVARWDEIAGIFSKAAVWQGALDRFAVAKAGKRGTAEVDDEFLAEIERWRELLARNLVLRNPHLRGHDVNWAVQQTIDRIVFLRICEARNLETYEQLRALLNGGHTYARLGELFRRADLRYNSGLFHFSEERGRAEAPDTLTPGLEIDDRVLKDIIEHLYYPQSPYEFSVLPADILGHVYERFLGKVIRLTPGRQVKIEEKPEVRKAGGVYYTPTYIVDYIVRQTVGPLLEGKTPAHGRSPGSLPRVADIACGSGSFLLGAYQYLLDWHLAYYLEEPERWLKGKRPALERVSGGATRLTIEERKRILMDHLYGVDIDPQAVEVTKLSLLLKVLEGEGVAGQLSLGVERVLPDLGRNIKCGNSLIGPEFYDGKLDLPDDETARRVNAFDWKKEFPEVMTAGGFDAVIGNPPWGGDIDRELDYFHTRYPATTKEHTDSYKLFVDRGLQLARTGGLISMIIPNTLLRQRRLKDVRSLMLQHKIVALVDLGEDVFEGVVAPSCIYVVEKNHAATDHQTLIIDVARLAKFDRVEVLTRKKFQGGAYEQRSFQENADLEFRAVPQDTRVPAIALGDFQYLACKDAGINYQRVSVGMREKGKSDLANRLLYEGERQKDDDKMFWKGTDINRYWIAEATSRFCRPYYQRFVRDNEVVHLGQKVYNATPKILLRQTADRIIATIDYQGVWFGRSIIAIVPSDKSDYRIEYFLGVLNSRYFEWLYERTVQETGRVFAQVKLSKLKQLPIRTINFTDPADAARHDRMISLVTQMLDLHKRLAAEGIPHEKAALQRRIEATDRQIDALVYELYGLTDAEIAVVEQEGAKGLEHEGAK